MRTTKEYKQARARAKKFDSNKYKLQVASGRTAVYVDGLGVHVAMNVIGEQGTVLSVYANGFVRTENGKVTSECWE